MKKFLKVYAMTLIFILAFLFLGGHTLLDMKRHVYRTGFVVAIPVAAVAYALYALSDRIDMLEKRVAELEARTRN